MHLYILIETKKQYMKLGKLTKHLNWYKKTSHTERRALTA